MDLTEYVKLATRTESRLETIVANPQLLVNLLNIHCASGRMLDQVKKHVFYGKEYAAESFNVDFQSIIQTLQHLTLIRLNGTPEEMGEEDIPEINPRLFHAIIGIATEATELCEALYSTMMGKEVDLVNLREENGDINWYQAIFYDEMTALGYPGTWEDDLVRNIDKLKARFPDKFTNENAINRNVESEREILEGD